MAKLAIPFCLALCVLIGCGGEDKKPANKKAASTSTLFSSVNISEEYQLADTGLLANTDTTSIAKTLIATPTTDSLLTSYFNNAKNIRFVPLALVKAKRSEGILIVKATAGSKKAALAVALDGKENPVAAMPFLLPDEDPGTAQSSSVDDNFTITKNIIKKANNEVVGEGKEVHSFGGNAFSLVMFDPVEDDALSNKNPIDTFPQTNRYGGDYLLGKKGIVSVRDGRYPSQLLVYIYTEDKGGECTGQMKGEFTITSTTTAAYRQGGDPCVLNLTFKANTVAIAEASGCGNYRGLDCPFSGTFTKKKPAPAKPSAAKLRRK